MIHEDLEGEALKDEVLRVARVGTLYDLDEEMRGAGRAENISVARLGHKMTGMGTEITFQFISVLDFVPKSFAVEAALVRMAKLCDVLVKEIRWHHSGGSGVLMVVWDSCTPIGAEVIDPMVPTRVSSAGINSYRYYGS